MGDVWNDFVAIFRKNGPLVDGLVGKFLSDDIRCTNVWRLDEPRPRFEREASEDMLLIRKLQAEVKRLEEQLSAAKSMVAQSPTREGLLMITNKVDGQNSNCF